MSDPLFGPEVRDMLEQNDIAGLQALCEELHPATIAEVVGDDFTAEQVWQLISHSDIRTQAAIFEYLPFEKQVEMAGGPHRPQVARLIGKMSHDDRVDLLRRMPQAVNEALLRLVDEADRRDIKTLFDYKENTVGAIMTTDYAWLPPTLTAAEAVDQLRQQAPDRETIYYIYVLDAAAKTTASGLAPRRLLGVISLRDLILAPRHVLLRELMEEELVTLTYTDDRSTAADLLAQYDFIAVPVVDENGGMLGIITHDDAIDVITEEATEDMQRQAGVSPIGQSYLTVGFFRLWRSRAQWLAVLFVAELGTFSVLSFFEDMLASLVVITLFIPLCISTGGNSGAQASTLVTRALALGDVTLSDWKRLLRREFRIGIALGLTLGLIALFRGALTPADTRGGPREWKTPTTVKLVTGELAIDENGDYVIPVGTPSSSEVEKELHVRLPAGASPTMSASDGHTYIFPTGSEIRVEPIGRWQLGLVIALAVLCICLWGTMVGASLPLLFEKLGWDPAVASGPIVATLVDITGIAIFCILAKTMLLG